MKCVPFADTHTRAGTANEGSEARQQEERNEAVLVCWIPTDANDQKPNSNLSL